MANQKISSLTSSSTPLSGTEVLPIVQSGTTKQVSVANLTAGRSVAAATFSTANGFSQATITNLTITDAEILFSGTPDGTGFEFAKVISTRDSTTYTYGSQLDFYTEGKNSGTTDTSTVKWSINSLGNLVQRVASKGVNFTANTPLAGMTSQLLNWYEEGTWTPTITAITNCSSPSLTSAKYTKNGRIVFCELIFTMTVTTASSPVYVTFTTPFSGVSNTQAPSGTGYTSTGYYGFVIDNSSGTNNVFGFQSTVSGGNGSQNFLVGFTYTSS